MPLIIYIPLCFYFIEKIIRENKTDYKFTFHYASTLSQQKLGVTVDGYNLHSIMLLLYPERTMKDTGFVLYLHSIMLLLYRKTSYRKRQES